MRIVRHVFTSYQSVTDEKQQQQQFCLRNHRQCEYREGPDQRGLCKKKIRTCLLTSRMTSDVLPLETGLRRQYSPNLSSLILDLYLYVQSHFIELK